MPTMNEPVESDKLRRQEEGMHSVSARDTHVGQVTGVGGEKVSAIRDGNAILRFLVGLESRIDKLSAFEAMGIERVPDEQRRPPQRLNMLLFWFSVLLSPTLIPIGMLGPILGLSVNVSIVLTITATIVGSAVPAFTATLSPPTGLRQIAVARYSLGLWGAKLCSVLNVVVNIGYATIASIVGGQLLRAVSGGGLPLAVGIVVVVAVSFAVSFFGYAAIHHFERFAWLPASVLLCVLYGQASAHFSPTPGYDVGIGLDFSGACLTYFAVIFGVCCSWCPISGDYYIHYPASTSPWLVFGLTYAGIVLPTVFVGILGNYFGGIISSSEQLGAIYAEGGVGSLILAVMSPPTAWAKFACVLFVLSFLGDVVCNIYSSALSMQLLGSHFVAVPRYAWCTVLSLATFGLAYGGRNVLETIINNLLSMLGYWTLAFAAILFVEHFWFRPRIGGYDLTAWQDPQRLPWGLAGTASLLIGIGFSFLGMDQTWYVGPVAKPIGVHGGDVGDELTVISVLLSYPLLRWFEIRHVGR
ncbi:nucleoside transporter [Purpureocillium lilacinum]|uniref:Nucleoside transporter n=1 Tax=Purpureocillium lilacinum TaxID=33203 RepID=A0A179GUA7_PURLI|nr:nucleoside transporter [Purpureocillium lilacinum]